MTRPANPAPQFFDDENNILVGGQMFYFRSGTSTPLMTYADNLENTLNTHPVILDSAGRLPNVFFTGSAKQVLRDANGVQIWERDPVGDQAAVGDFTPWLAAISYDVPDKVIASNNRVYQTLIDDNQGNDPTLNPGTNTFWKEIGFLETYNTNITYVTGENTRTLDGNIWKSVITQSGNNPSTDDGTNWLPSIDGSKIPEVIVLEDLNSWDIPLVADFTGVASEARQIDASANTIDIALPVLVAGDSFIYHNLITSTFKVQILNPLEIIRGSRGNIAAGVNMEIKAGQSVQLVAVSATILSIVGVLI